MDITLIKLSGNISITDEQNQPLTINSCVVTCINGQPYVLSTIWKDEELAVRLTEADKALIVAMIDALPHESNTEVEGKDYIYVMDGDREVKIVFRDILYICAMKRGVEINKKGDQKESVFMSLDKFQALLPEDRFFKAHRSYVINCTSIKEVKYLRRGAMVTLGDEVKLAIAFDKTADFKKIYKKE